MDRLRAPPRDDGSIPGSRHCAGHRVGEEVAAPLLAAAMAFFGDNDKLDPRTRLTAYASAIDRVSRSYPDDREASLLHALSLLATADPLDATYARQRKPARCWSAS